jgi:hypothetical protein
VFIKRVVAKGGDYVEVSLPNGSTICLVRGDLLQNVFLSFANFWFSWFFDRCAMASYWLME